MTKKLSKLTDNISKLIQNNFSNIQSLNGICFELGDLISSNVFIIGKDQKIIAMDVVEGSEIIFDTKNLEDGTYIESLLNDQFNNIVELKENVSLNSFYIKNTSKSELKKNVATIIPIFISNKRVATFVLNKKDENYTEDDIELIKVVAIIISLVLKYSQSEQFNEDKRKITIVKSAISTLSYSELEAVLHIFKELNGYEDVLIASKIADRVGITRSVIVNALRKLESAGVIESRSLGMKGTYIKVINELLLEELDKLKN